MFFIYYGLAVILRYSDQNISDFRKRSGWKISIKQNML
jgi:hypothetical protein